MLQGLKGGLLKSDINNVKTKINQKKVTAFLKQWSNEYMDLLPIVIESEINPRRRRKGSRRVPTKIAFELVRAIHFCGGDGMAIKQLRQHLVHNLSLKEKIIRAQMRSNLLRQIKAHRILLEHTQSSTKKAALEMGRQALLTKSDQLKRLKKLWSTYGVRGQIKNWTISAKLELLKILLTPSRKNIIENMPGKNARENLIRKLESRNKRTLKRAGW